MDTRTATLQSSKHPVQKPLVGLLAAAAGLALVPCAFGQALTPAFTYQGELKNGGTVVDGAYDLRFRLYDAMSGGAQLGTTQCVDNVQVVGGKFTVQLDFGGQFAGQQRFLDIQVRADTGLNCSNTTGFTVLTPRQAMTATPYATYAPTAGTAATATTAVNATNATTAANAAQLNGQSAAFYQNAGNLVAGTIPDGRLSSVVPLTINNNTFSGANTFTGVTHLTNTGNTYLGDGASLTGLWRLGGNMGADPASYFVGTVDNQPLAMRVNNQEVLRLTSSGVGINTQTPGARLNVAGATPGVNIFTGDLAPFGSAGLEMNFSSGGIADNALVYCAVDGEQRFFVTSAGQVVARRHGSLFSPPGTVFLDPIGSVTGEGELRIESPHLLAETDKLGVSVENTGFNSIVNLDNNFRLNGSATTSRGGAVRIDGRDGLPLFQFIYRAVGGTESQCLAVDHVGNLSASGTVESKNSSVSVALDASGATTGNGEVRITSGNSGTDRVGVSVETGGGNSLVNLDNNFRLEGRTTSNRGGAVRIDGRGSGEPLFQFLFRGAGSTIESQCASLTHTGDFVARSVAGVSTATAGDAFGVVQGRTTSPSGTAVDGRATSGTGPAWGVFGQSSSIAGIGVYGLASATSGGVMGVLGESNSSATLGDYGVYSQGDLGASGLKTFRIDHPADPENKYLMHYCSEAPEPVNFYRGTVVLDGDGTATIDLPSYFATINKDPSYTLTAVGSPMPTLYVASEISEEALRAGEAFKPGGSMPACSFTIAGGMPGGRVCWRVEAVRNDLWVRHRGVAVEIDKQEREKGTYQHPALYGQPRSKGVRWDKMKDDGEGTVIQPAN